MSKAGVRWAALATAIIGALIGELASYPVGVGITFVGFFAAFGSIKLFNVLMTRIIFITTLVLHALMVWRATDNVLLTAAPLGLALIPPYESVNRRLSYQGSWLVPVGFVLALGLALLARPYSLKHLAVLPALLLLGVFSRMMVLGMIDMNRRGKTMTARVGKPFPDFSLPARLGQPEFRLSEHRGGYVLVCLLRGDWCPVCHVMMRIIAKDAPVLAARGVKVVAVSADEGADAETFARMLGVDYTLLIDPKCIVATAVGAVHPDEPARGKNTNLPAMFLVDPQGELTFVSTANDLTLHDPRRIVDMLPTAA